MMEIKLFIDGNEKTFVNGFVSGRMFRKAIEIRKLLNDGEVDETKIDKVVDYVVDFFGKQFSRDDYYDGIPADKFMSTIKDCINYVVNKSTGKNGDNPNM